MDMQMFTVVYVYMNEQLSQLVDFDRLQLTEQKRKLCDICSDNSSSSKNDYYDFAVYFEHFIQIKYLAFCTQSRHL